MSTIIKTVDVTHEDCGAETTIKFDTVTREPQQFGCQGCNEIFYVQVQVCENCGEECVIGDPVAFESGKYSCANCHVVGLLKPWYPPAKPQKKTSLFGQWFKNLFKKKKGTLVHDASHNCPECGGNSLFLNVEASGTSAICADCSKDFKVTIDSSRSPQQR